VTPAEEILELLITLDDKLQRGWDITPASYLHNEILQMIERLKLQEKESA
jgi:hypothetical protein